MHLIKCDDNVKIAVNDVNPRQRETVLFIHGWPLDRRMFEYQANWLAQQKIRCILVDLRGFGASDRPVEGYTYDQMAKDIFTVVNRLGLTSFNLVGFSMGAAIAIKYMSLFRQFGVSKLILLSAAAPCFTRKPDFPYGTLTSIVDDLLGEISLDRPRAVEEFGKTFFNASLSLSFIDWFNRMSLDSSVFATTKCLEALRDEDLRSDLTKITVPTGIFHGLQDSVCSYDLALQLNKGIQGSELFTFENSGHGIFYDEMAEFNHKFFDYILN